MRFNQFEKHDRGKSLEILGDRSLENLQTTLDSMKFAHDRGWGYRISSTLFPLFNLDKANVCLDDLPNATLIYDKFHEIHAFMSSQSPKDFRISFHPDHFNVLCSANAEVVRRTINELDHHAWLMDNFAGVESRSYWYPLNIHMSRSAGDPQVIAKEFISNYQKLPERVQKRLVLENEDKGVWTPDMLFELIHLETGIPITYDTLHHRCNPGAWQAREAFRICCSTWKAHDVNPLFHYSEGGANGNPRAHTDFATSSPGIWREEHESDYTQNIQIDWDIEIKQKDYAIDHLIDIENRHMNRTGRSSRQMMSEGVDMSINITD